MIVPLGCSFGGTITIDTDRSTRGIHVNICIGCSGTCVGGEESLAVDPCIGHGLVQTILGSCSPLELPIISHSAFNIFGWLE